MHAPPGSATLAAMADRDAPRSAPPSRRRFLALGAGLGAGSLAAGCGDAGGERAADAAAATEELFADLEDASGTVAPIGPDEHAARRRRLGRILSDLGVDAYLCEGGATMGYLSGVRWGHSERLFALVVLADGDHFFLSPAFEAEKAKLSIEKDGGPGGPIVAWDEHEYAWEPLAAALRGRRVERLVVDPELRYFAVERLGAAFGRERIASGQAARLALRGRKDSHELAILRRVNELTQEALAAVARVARAGMSAAEVGRMVHAAQRRLGLTGTWALTLPGPAAAYPHGDSRDRRIERDELLLIDAGGTLHGYQSDNTRTWVVEGTPSEEHVRAWSTVREAQRRAFEAIRPGVPCRAVDEAARKVIEDAGYGSGYAAFTHRLGHGIGMQGHEDPYFDGGSEVVLEEGQTFSDEPGIYLLDRFGVRLEDVVVVTARGADHFGSWQEGPESPA